MADIKSSPTTDVKSVLSQLENILEEYLVRKSPVTLPANIKEIVVKIAPWLVIIGVILSVPGIIALLGASAVVMPYAGVVHGINYTISMVILAVSLVLEAIAIPGLFKRSLSAWRLLFYATIVSTVSSIVNLNIIGAVIGALIGFYVLFQVKQLYK